MNHKHDIDLETLETLLEALSLAADYAVLDSDRVEFKELRKQFRDVMKNWPKAGDKFIEELCCIADDKSWDSFSPEFHEAFEQNDKEQLDRIAEKAQNIDDYDHEESRLFIVRALEWDMDTSTPAELRLANLIEIEADPLYEEED